MQTHANKFLLTSRFCYTCHLVLVSSFHLCLLGLSLPSISICPSHYFCNNAAHCLGYFHTSMTLVLFTAFRHSLPSVCHLCQVICLLYLPPSLCLLFPKLRKVWTVNQLTSLPPHHPTDHNPIQAFPLKGA